MALRGMRRLATATQTSAGSAAGSLLYPMTNLSSLRQSHQMQERRVGQMSLPLACAPGKPLRVVAGKGAVVYDDTGKEYLEEPCLRFSEMSEIAGTVVG